MSGPRGKRGLLAITSGDQDGIGPEVSLKALCANGREKNVVFLLFRAPKLRLREQQRLRGVFRKSLAIHWRDSSAESLRVLIEEIDRDQYDLIEILSDQSPAVWVKRVATLCAEGLLDGLVTAPLSKTEIKKAGMKEIGHTQILETVTGAGPAFMGFIGDHFSVVLGSGHLPVTKAGKDYLKNFEAAVGAADQLRKLLPPAQRRLPIGVLAINPHAGEKGLIGREEEALSLQLARLQKKFNLVGPLVPDVAFLRENWKKFGVYLAAYHDQGLIPFKVIHGFQSGIHVTLGLPIHRSSVDHGTAKDLFGKNMADHRSMLKALRWSVKTAQAKGRKR